MIYCKSECLHGLYESNMWDTLICLVWNILFWFTILLFGLNLLMFDSFWSCISLIVEAKKGICNLVKLTCIGINGYNRKEYVFIGLPISLE